TERHRELVVRSVHQRVRTGLDLRRPGVDVVGAGASGGDHVAAGVGTGLDEWLHARRRLLDARGAILQSDDVPLVAHHTANLETAAASERGEATGVVGIAAAPRQADVHIHENLTDAVARGRVDG